MKNLFCALIFVFAVGFSIAGCQKDTNELTPGAVDKANVDRAKAIDNDPTMTPEGKQKMKEMLGLVPGKGRAGGGGPSQGR